MPEPRDTSSSYHIDPETEQLANRLGGMLAEQRRREAAESGRYEFGQVSPGYGVASPQPVAPPTAEAPAPWRPAEDRTSALPAPAAPPTATREQPFVDPEPTPTEPIKVSQLPPPPAEGYNPRYDPATSGGNMAQYDNNERGRSSGANRAVRWAGRSALRLTGGAVKLGLKYVALPAAALAIPVGLILLWDATKLRHGDWGWNKELIPGYDVSVPDIDIWPSDIPGGLGDGDGVDLLPRATLPAFVSTTTTTPR